LKDWVKYGKSAIFRDISKDGLLSKFLKDYKSDFGGTINPSCSKCLNTYWNKYINSLIMSNEKIECDYELHKKYDGIQIEFGGEAVLNATMTNKIAVKLLKTHPRGALLFSKLPKEEVKEIKVEVVEPTKKVNRTRKKNK